MKRLLIPGLLTALLYSPINVDAVTVTYRMTALVVDTDPWDEVYVLPPNPFGLSLLDPMYWIITADLSHGIPNSGGLDIPRGDIDLRVIIGTFTWDFHGDDGSFEELNLFTMTDGGPLAINSEIVGACPVCSVGPFTADIMHGGFGIVSFYAPNAIGYGEQAFIYGAHTETIAFEKPVDFDTAPEPGTWILLLSAAACAWWVRRGSHA